MPEKKRYFQNRRKPSARFLPDMPFQKPNEPSTLAKAWQLLGRPAAAAHALLTGKGALDAYRGLTGEYQGSFTQDLARIHPLLAIPGLVADIATDPVMYLGGGVARGAVRLAKGVNLSAKGAKTLGAIAATERAAILARMKTLERAHQLAGNATKARAAAQTAADIATHPAIHESVDRAARRKLLEQITKNPAASAHLLDRGGIKFAGKTIVPGSVFKPAGDALSRAKELLLRVPGAKRVGRAFTRNLTPVDEAQALALDQARWRSAAHLEDAKTKILAPLAAYAKAGGHDLKRLAAQVYDAAENPLEHIPVFTYRRVNDLGKSRLVKNVTFRPKTGAIDKVTALPAELQVIAREIQAHAKRTAGAEAHLGLTELVRHNPVNYVRHVVDPDLAVDVAGARLGGKHAAMNTRDAARLHLSDPLAATMHIESSRLARTLATRALPQKEADRLAHMLSSTLDRTVTAMPPLSPQRRAARGLRDRARAIRAAGALDHAELKAAWNDTLRLLKSTKNEHQIINPKRILTEKLLKTKTTPADFMELVDRGLVKRQALSAAEVNKAALAKKKPPPLALDPAMAYAERGIMSEKALAARRFYDTLRHPAFGGRVSSTPIPGHSPIKVPKLVDRDSLKNYQFPNHVAEDINRIATKFEDTKIQNAVARWIIDTYQKAIFTWKGWQLSTPSFHVRNMAGDHINMLAGSWNPRTLKIGHDLERGAAITIKTPTRTWTADQVRAMGKHHGIDGAFYTSDLDTELAEYLTRPTTGQKMKSLRHWLWPDAEHAWISINRDIGNKLENTRRLSFFADGLMKGMSPEQAAERVRRHLFDYGDVTKFEKAGMKTLFPFYTYLRKAAPLWGETILRNPKFATTPHHLARAAEIAGGGVEPEDDQVPLWVRDNLGVRWRQTGPGQYEYFLLRGWLPQTTIKAFAEPLLTGIQMLTPTIRLPLELATGYKLGSATRISRFENEPASVLGIPLPGKKTEHVIRSIATVNEFDKLLVVAPSDSQRRTFIERVLAFIAGAKSYNVDTRRE